MKRIVKIVVALVIVAALTRVYLVRRAKAKAARLPIVDTATVTRGDVSVTVSGTGVIEPLTTVDVKSEAYGRVIELAVDVGDVVQEGEVIARIDPAESQSQYEQARADVDAALARVNQAQVSLNLQRRLTPTQIEEARQQLDSARARLDQARKTLELDQLQLQTAIQQAEESLASAQVKERQARHQAEAQPSLTETAIQQAEAGYQAALEDLRQLKEATHPQSRAQVETTLEQAKGGVAQARAGVIQAQAALDQARAALISAQENLTAQEEALRQLVDATHPQARASAQAAYDQAKANAVNAEKQLNRQTELLSKGFVAQAQVDNAQAQYEVAQAQLASARERLDTITAEQDAERKVAQARVADARTKVSDAQARIASAQAQLNDAQVRVTNAEAEQTNASRRMETLDVEQAAALRSAEARVNQAKASLESARANAVQMQLRQEDVLAAQATVRQAEASLASARANAKQLEIRRSEVRTAEAAVKQALAALENAQANRLQEAVRFSDITSARAQMQRAVAQLENSSKTLRETTIHAPRTGIVLQKYVEQGTMVQSGSRSAAGSTAGNVVQLGDMSRMFIDCQVDETDIAKVWEDQPVDITIDAFPEQIFEGKVTRIDPQTTTEQNVTYVHVQVEIDLPDPRLKPGMTATCDFVVERSQDVLVVPSEAVRAADDGSPIVELLVDQEPKTKEPGVRSVLMQENGKIITRWIVPHKIEKGVEGNESTEIASGLQEGQVVVVSVVEPERRQSPSLGGMMRTGPGGR